MTIDTIWYTRCPVPTAFAVALRLGWLDEEFGKDGIAFRSLAASREAALRQSHFEHTQANSVRHGGGIPPLLTRARGRDLRVVGLSISGSRQRVLALPGSGIRRVEDLRGKRLSIPRRVNDPIDFWRETVLRGFDLVLKQAGLTLADALQVDLPITRTFVEETTAGTGRADALWDATAMLGFQRDELAALIRGEVDAILTQGATSVTLRALLGATVVGEVAETGDPSSYVNNQPFTLTVSGALAEERSDLAGRLVARVRDAADWARDNEVETKRIIAAETGLPESLVDDAYGPTVHRELGADLSPEKLAAFQTLHDDLLARGFLDAPVDLGAFVDPRPLAASADFLRHAA
jgi:ABC-type nitrate/sulfonate/bicarbonate transport system substrate-binding protein